MQTNINTNHAAPSNPPQRWTAPSPVSAPSASGGSDRVTLSEEVNDTSAEKATKNPDAELVRRLMSGINDITFEAVNRGNRKPAPYEVIR